MKFRPKAYPRYFQVSKFVTTSRLLFKLDGDDLSDMGFATRVPFHEREVVKNHILIRYSFFIFSIFEWYCQGFLLFTK